MNDILRILLGEARPRQAADESLFLSGRNYLGVRPPMPNIPPVAGLPPVPPQVGPVAGLVTINDNGQIFQLAPGEVYEGGIRIIPGPAPTFTGLLDDYPGAAAAFSLRRLSVNYTGPLVQVRRASDNDETTIPYKDDGTLDVGVLNAFAAGTDAFVSEWPDQSGNGNDAVQATTARQPKVYDSVTGVVLDNAKPSFDFDGSDDNLIFPFTYNKDEYKSVFIVRRSSDTNGMFLSSVSVPNFWVDISQVSTNTQIQNNFAQLPEDSSIFYKNGVQPFSGATTRTQYAAEMYDGAQVLITVMGEPNTRDLTSTQMYIGRYSITGFDYAGKVQELILYPSDQSANRAGIESNINTYYSIY